MNNWDNNGGWDQNQHHQGEHGTDEHTQGQAHGHVEGHHQESPPSETESSEVDQESGHSQEETPEEDHSVFDVSPSGGSSEGKYSDNDIRYIFRFVYALSSATEQRRDAFIDAIGIGGDMANLVTSLYPAEGRASSLFELYNLSNDLDPSDPIAYGQSIVKLMGSLSDMDPEDIRALSKSIDAITTEFSPDSDLIRYTRRQSPQDVAQKMIAVIPTWSSDAKEFLDWATDLLVIWPRKEA